MYLGLWIKNTKSCTQDLGQASSGSMNKSFHSFVTEEYPVANIPPGSGVKNENIDMHLQNSQTGSSILFTK